MTGPVGREPIDPENKELWFPKRPPHPYRPAPKEGGYPLGEQVGRGMASVREVVGQVTEANVKTGEALGAIAEVSQGLENCLASIEAAESLVSGALDGSGAQSLSEYLGLVQSAKEKVQAAHADAQAALGDLGAGMERGESAIGNLLA